MTDRLLIVEGKPQRFGTQWLFDEHKYPFLPTIESPEQVSDRRKRYGLDPLRWPRSLAIPDAEQPWLSRPISEAVMRSPTSAELDAYDP